MALPKLSDWSLNPAILAQYLLKAGGTLTDFLTLHADPTSDMHAATKRYVDRPAFHAYRLSSAALTGIATITWTKVTCAAVLFNRGNAYDGANGRFTPTAGPYLIRAQVGWSAGIASGEFGRVAIYKNGTDDAARIKQAWRIFGGTSLQTTEVTAIVDANGTDWYEVRAYASGAGDKTISGDISLTYFEAMPV